MCTIAKFKKHFTRDLIEVANKVSWGQINKNNLICSSKNHIQWIAQKCLQTSNFSES